MNTPKITDHSIIGIRLGNNRENYHDPKNDKLILSRCMKPQAYYEINLKLLECNWNTSSFEVDVIFEDRRETCNYIVNSYNPMREIRVKNCHVLWHDREVSLFSRVMVFKTILQPHFDYCATLLFLLDSGSIQSLQVLFNRCRRTILRCSRYTSINLMLSTLR